MATVISQKHYPKSEEIPKDKNRENHPARLESKNDLAVFYKEQDQYDKAEPLLIEAIGGRHIKLGYTHPHILGSWNNLIELYEA